MRDLRDYRYQRKAFLRLAFRAADPSKVVGQLHEREVLTPDFRTAHDLPRQNLMPETQNRAGQGLSSQEYTSRALDPSLETGSMLGRWTMVHTDNQVRLRFGQVGHILETGTEIKSRRQGYLLFLHHAGTRMHAAQFQSRYRQI
jgi:hypothetical protein